MTIIDTKDGINKYPHHKQIPFTFSNVAYTTITNRRNWNYDKVIVREVVFPREGDDGDDENEEHSGDNEEEGENEGYSDQAVGGT